MDPLNQQVPMGDTTKSKSVGPVIGLIIILALILLGGIYFYSTRSDNTPIPVEQDGGIGATPETTDTAAIESQSTSDDTSSIEADLETTNMDSLDSDFKELQ